MHARQVLGLMSTCRQVRVECKNEIATLVGRLIEENSRMLRSQKPQRAILFHPSDLLFAMTNLTFELTGPIFPRVEDYIITGDEKYLDPGILLLLNLHLSELTIQLRDFSETTEDDFDPGWTLCELLRDMDVWFNGPPPRIRRAIAETEKGMLPFQPVNRTTVRTRSMVVLWKHPSCTLALATYRQNHYINCMYTQDYRNHEEVQKRWGTRPVASDIQFEGVGKIVITWEGIMR
ncbi:hypothetical protein NX059_001335 [Plenodomus lindquistii]|nr:hypothetical protein NX059_001335 [Plenodomus lindquistii]